MENLQIYREASINKKESGCDSMFLWKRISCPDSRSAGRGTSLTPASCSHSMGHPKGTSRQGRRPIELLPQKRKGSPLTSLRRRGKFLFYLFKRTKAEQSTHDGSSLRLGIEGFMRGGNLF